MSYIPTAAMPHAKTHDDADTPAAPGPVERRFKSAVDTVKAHPRTGLAIGATLLLGAVAAAVIPAARAEAPKPAPKRKRAAKRTPAKPKKAA